MDKGFLICCPEIVASFLTGFRHPPDSLHVWLVLCNETLGWHFGKYIYTKQYSSQVKFQIDATIVGKLWLDCILPYVAEDTRKEMNAKLHSF